MGTDHNGRKERSHITTFKITRNLKGKNTDKSKSKKKMNGMEEYQKKMQLEEKDENGSQCRKGKKK